MTEVNTEPQRIFQSPDISEIKLSFEFSLPHSSIYSLSFSPDNKYLAASTDKGEMLFFCLKKKKHIVSIPALPKKVAFTCVKWRIPNDIRKARNVFTLSTSDGVIESYHLNTQKRLFSLKEEVEGDPSINSIEYSPDSMELAVIGADPEVRLYDMVEMKKKMSLRGDDSIIPGHTNRLFAVKMLEDKSTLITSGWDQRILFWDLRIGKPFESIFGSNIYGDGLDISKGLLLTCNHREQAQIQLYDLNSRKLITSSDGSDFQWVTDTIKTVERESYLNFGKLDKITGKFILTGGSYNGKESDSSDLENEAKLFDITSKHYATFKMTKDPINSGEFSPNGKKIALGSADGKISVYDVELDF